MNILASPLRLASCAGGALLLAGGYTPGHAATETVPELTFSLIGDDNPRLRNEEEVSDGVAMLDALINFVSYDERGELMIEPRLRANAYGDEINDDLENVDAFLRSGGNYLWESTQAGFRLDYSSQSVRSAEALEAVPIDPDLEDPIDTETGELVMLDQERRQALLSPYVDFGLSERSRMRFEVRHIDVSYSGEEVSGRSDFDDTRFSVAVARELGALSDLSVGVAASRFEADRTQNETDSVALEGTYTRTLSQDWSWSLSMGVERSEFTFAEPATPDPDEPGDEPDPVPPAEDPTDFVESDDTNVTIGLGFRKRTDLGLLNLDIDRFVNPNASGYVVRRNQLRVYASRQMRPRVSGHFAFRFVNTETVGDVDPTEDRNYLRTELGLDWALTQQTSLGFGYRFTQQDFRNRDRGEATSNQIYLGITYRGASQRAP